MRPLTPLVTLVLLTSAQAQTNHPAPKQTIQLPITRVALYKNGVGFFEHAGRVTGDQSVTIDFTSAQLNDVLQSLTALDLSGGRISGAGYNSTTPLDQQLKTLPLALSTDPSDVDFYNAIRGARVEVTAPGLSMTGRLLSIDLRARPARTPTAPRTKPPPQADRRFLTVVSDTGTVRTLELTSATSVLLLDTALHTDVTRYLELLASTRNQGLRHLTLLDRGTGSRDLRVSYISEVPVWKSTYRILFTDAKTDQTATLQGWSVVDNTTGSDWINVHLDLIAGAPQSFIQPLSTPYYTRRPEIPLPAEAQLTPQTHESGNEADALSAPTKIPKQIEMLKEDGAPPAADRFHRRTSPLNGRAIGNGRNAGGFAGGVQAASSGTGMLAALYAHEPLPSTTPTPPKPPSPPKPPPPPSTTSSNTPSPTPSPSAKTSPPSSPSCKPSSPSSASPSGPSNSPSALRALWLTNASTLTLDRGSFSIVENGNFGGEGLLDPIHPGEKRLLSYAADQAVRVTQSAFSNNRTRQPPPASAKASSPKPPPTSPSAPTTSATPPPTRAPSSSSTPSARAGHLDSDPKPAETTPTAYRFRLLVARRQTGHLHVAERHTSYEYIRLIDRTEDQLLLLLRNAKANPATLAHAPARLRRPPRRPRARRSKSATAEAEIATITADQTRLRENMKALKGTPEETRPPQPLHRRAQRPGRPPRRPQPAD